MPDERPLPRYPIYVPSYRRYEYCHTAKFLIEDGTPFHLVVQPQERAEYARRFGEERVITLPHNVKGLLPTRNWIREHATKAGHERHWQIDDNIRYVYRWYKGVRMYCDSAIALRVTEDFIDRYENVAVAGLNYVMFGVGKQPPFHLNQRVYSCSLVLNSLPFSWRLRYNDDTDLCLQVLAAGWCTVLMNVFLIQKITTMTVKGGNTDDLYQGDGRLTMARSLERVWPGVVKTDRRFKRPQHVVKDEWRRFDTPLKFKPGLSLDDFKGVNEYGMRLAMKRPIRSEKLRGLIEDNHREIEELEAAQDGG